MKFEKPILVTKPIAPDREEFLRRVEEVIDSGWFTNMGGQHNALEAELARYLAVENLSLFNSGATALISALKALDLPVGSEVITTPFTFAATPHAIAWNALNVVFADIEADRMTLSADAIERAITPNTSAILPVHVYGFPCDVEAIEGIAKKHNLKVVYDAAHAFTTELDGVPISNWGDITMFSFHSTKLFNTIEGGALVYSDRNLGKKIYELRNFGIKVFDPDEDASEGIKNKDFVSNIGINGKLNELQAAWGRVLLKEVGTEQKRRGLVADAYKELLADIDGIAVPELPSGASNSFQYFPVLFRSEAVRDRVYDRLLAGNVFSRKYFYPLCSDFSVYENLPSSRSSNLPVATDIAGRVLCLPFYGDLQADDIRSIVEIIKSGID